MTPREYEFWNMFILGVECGLDIRQLKCILWNYNCDKSRTEIAHFLNITPQAVSMIFIKIYKQMKNKLNKNGAVVHGACKSRKEAKECPNEF